MAAPSARALRMPLTLSDGARRPSLLLIEDSKLLVRILGARLERELGIDVVPATSLAQARELLERDSSRFFLALVDLVLPDAPRGEAVNLVTRTGIPAVVLSASFAPHVREAQLGKPGVVDYVPKDSPASIDITIALVDQLRRNSGTTVMVVDDSPMQRARTAALLESHRYTVLRAEHGAQALELLAEDPSVRLVALAPETFAVLRFSGSTRDEAVDARRAELLRKLTDTGWRAAGEPVAWFYDPPWRLPSNRRNEVAVLVTRAP